MPMDDTKVHKTGRHIPGASWQRDPMSPPFHVNFIWGLRFLQASLVFPHHQEGNFSARAFPELFTPEDVRKSDRCEWKHTRIYFGTKRRKVGYKVLDNVLWRRGAATRHLRLIVIAPVPYKMSTHSHINYRDPAYLLSTDLKTSPKKLLQHYFDRWQIEVNHRDEKTILAVGHSQVWSPLSVPRQPAFTVACYSTLLLSCLRHSGPGRTPDFAPLPKWRNSQPNRPSLQDMLTLLRKNLCETSVSCMLDVNFGENITIYAKT